MSLGEIVAILSGSVVERLSARSRRSVLSANEPLEQRLERAISVSAPEGIHNGSVFEPSDLLSRFYTSNEIINEVASLIQTGELDHDEWDSVFSTLRQISGGDPQAEAPSPTAFQASLTDREAETEAGPQLSLLGPSLSASTVSGRNVVVGVQNIYDVRYGSDRLEIGASTLRESYLRRIVSSLNSISLAGIDPRVATEGHDRIALRDIYVHLHAKNDVLRPESPLFNGPAAHLIAEASKVVLLGDPGSGKSTLLNFVTLCLAGECLDSSLFNLGALTPTGRVATFHERGKRARRITGKWPSTSGRLPVRVVLRDFASFCIDQNSQPDAEMLWRYITSELQSASLGDFSDTLRAELLRDGGVLLFDGLDEVSDSESQREQIVASLEDFAATFSLCKVVVTSRTYAYRHQGWRLQSFAEAELKNLSLSSISEFVRLWYQDVARRSGSSAVGTSDPRAEELVSAIKASQNLLELAVRPLLLTLMASLHAWRGGSLPEKREQLYSDAVDLLLDTWESQRVKELPDGTNIMLQPSLLEWLQCDRDAVRSVLEQLAYGAHHESGSDGRETADIAEDELIAKLTKISRNPNARPLRLIEYLSERAGIVVQRGTGVYAFPHRTFQEYLAACYITENDYPYSLITLFCSAPSHWREVALLALAKASRGTSAAGFFTAQEACPDPAEGHDLTHEDLRATILAAHSLIESGWDQSNERGRRLLRQVRDLLLYAMHDSTFPRLDRVEAGQLLGKLGDVRSEATTVEDSSFCYVPSGQFKYIRLRVVRDGPEQEDSLPDKRVLAGDSLDVTLSYSFWFAKYPVTNSQYLQFIDAGGYANELFWAEAFAAKAWRPGEVLTTEYEDDKNDDEKADAEDPSEGEWHESALWRGHPSRVDLLAAPNQPVSGITWYEALAYSRWLSTLLKGRFWATLPSTLEWDLAARGSLKHPERPIIASLRDFVDSPSVPSETTSRFVANSIPHRLYPWGENSPDDSQAFIGFESRTMRAHFTGRADGIPVGTHPKGESVYGVADLCGNLWQHTRSAFRAHVTAGTFSPQDFSEGLLLDRMGYRSTKGGANWIDDDCTQIGFEIPLRATEDIVAGIRIVLFSANVQGDCANM